MSTVSLVSQSTADRDFEIFEKNRDQLQRIAADVAQGYDRIGVRAHADSFRLLLERLASSRFKVMVLGEFKRGKSTFINALLGERILPSYAIPCTAVINEIKWAETPRVVLYFRHPLPERLSQGIPAAALSHIQEAGGDAVPPLEIEIADLESYVTIQEPEKDQAQAVAESPYSKVEIFWPLDLCAQGVELIDSPGLNENEVRAQVARDYLGEVDAVLFVLSATTLAGMTELHVIDNDLNRSGHEHLFLICNRFDEIEPHDRERVRSYAHNKLRDRTAFGESGIFFLSSRDALNAKLAHDLGGLERSGLPHLEEALRRFLTRDRARVKLLQPARELQNVIATALGQLLPQQLDLLGQELEEIEERYRAVEPQLADAERERLLIIRHLESERGLLRREVEMASARQLRKTIEAIPEWVERYEPKSQVKLVSLRHKEQIEALSKELGPFLQSRIEGELQTFQEEALTPMVDQAFERMKLGIEANLESFYARLDRIEASLSGQVSATSGDLSDASGAERFFASLGGLLLGNLYSAAHGARFGFKGLAGSILVQAAIFGVLHLILGVTNPWILVPALLGGGLLTGLFQAGSLTTKAKAKIGEVIADEIAKTQAESARGIADKVDQEAARFVAAADQALGAEISQIRDQVEAVLAEKRAGEESLDRRRQELAAVRETLTAAQSDLKELILAVEG